MEDLMCDYDGVTLIFIGIVVVGAGIVYVVDRYWTKGGK